MSYAILISAHALAALVMGVAVVGVFVSNERARRTWQVDRFRQLSRRAARLEQRLLVPAVMVLLVSGTWLVVSYYAQWSALQLPWLVGMAALFVCQSIWANTVTHRHAARLDRLASELPGAIGPTLAQARVAPVPTFGHFAEPLVYLLIVALGAFKPMAWTPVFAGIAGVMLIATALTAHARRPARYALAPSSLSSASVDGEGLT